MFRHIWLQLKHFSFKGRNQWSRAFVCGRATVQGAPSRTLWCYFNVASCNCVEQACFFSSGSNRGQPPQQPSDPWLASRGGPGLRPVWSSTCWENFTQQTLLDSSFKAGGFRSQGPLCIKVNNTESGKSLCLGDFFKSVFLKLTFGRSTLQLHTQDSDPIVRATVELVFYHFMFLFTV